MMLENLIFFRPMRYFLITLVAFFTFFSISYSAIAREEVITRIQVENNQRVEEATVLSYLEIKEGERFDKSKINKSIKKMFATGLFSDISTRLDGGTLIVTVQENPIINTVSFEGNKKINEETLKSETSLAPRSVYTRAKVKNDVKRIQDIYRKSGRFSVSVSPKAVTLDNNRIDLVYEIKEGKKTTVKKILFIGNKNFDSETLKKVINTKEKRWYSFYSGNDTYDPDKVAFDSELLRKFYLSKGYADFKMIPTVAEISKDRESFVLTFTVTEGDKYIFGQVNVDSQLADLQTDDVRKVIKTFPDETFSATLVEDSIDKITSHLNDIGYAFVEVSTKYDRDPENKIMGITYNIKEGPKVYIERINVSGNVRTLDKVIRREFRLAEGDPFNAAKIRRSQQRIQNLGFFDKVTLKTGKGSQPDRANVDVSVLEKATGELSFGAGFSSNDGALGNISIKENNLLGKGQILNLGVQKSTRTTQVDMGFTEPYFLGRDISAGFNLFNIAYDQASESSFSSTTQGGTLHASYSLTENLRHLVKYSIKTVDITDIQSDASAFISQQAGETTTSLVGHSLTYDKRDNRFAPTSGYFVRFNQDVAGFGGDTKFLKNEFLSGFYKSILREDVILGLSGKGGIVTSLDSDDVNINERYFIGGNIIRGFKNAGIGPRDRVTRDALGGKTYYIGSAELTFPLGLPEELGFKGGAFIDAGSLFDTDDKGANVVDSSAPRASVGLGLSWSSPLGPIKIDYAVPFAKDDLDRTQLLRFDFGTRF